MKNVLELKNLTKRFGEVVANNNVSLTLGEGEILSLLGENGSGKTTLMNMVAGIYMPDQGEIYVNGEKVDIRSPKDSLKAGIGMIHQHFKLVDVFTAAENIVLGQEGEKGSYDVKEINNKVREIIKKYEFNISPDKKVYEMSVSEKQTVEIIKVLYRGAKILILDEPTAVLTPQENEKLFEVIRNMIKHGRSVIIITHKLQEVLSVSDRVVVLRKGEYIGEMKTSDATEKKLTEMMVGRSIDLNIKREKYHDKKLRLKVENLSVINKEKVKMVDDVSFEAYGGEILGIAGIAGSGQKEILESIAGLESVEDGSKITFYDYESEKDKEVDLTGLRPIDIMRKGVMLSFVPEDRLGMGLVGSMNITSNIMLRSFINNHSIFVDTKKPREIAKRIVSQLEVVTPDIDKTPLSKLSGGNVQKVLVGREIELNPKVLMSAYAVRGLDINTSYTIYDLLTKEKMKGNAVLYVGEDLDVLLALCDRVLVLCDGKVSGLFNSEEVTKEKIGLYMTKLGG